MCLRCVIERRYLDGPADEIHASLTRRVLEKVMIAFSLARVRATYPNRRSSWSRARLKEISRMHRRKMAEALFKTMGRESGLRQRAGNQRVRD